MSKPRLAKSAAFAAIAFVVLVVANGVLVPQPPRVDESAEAILAYARDYDFALLTANLVWLLSGIPLVWFLAYVRGLGDRDERVAPAARAAFCAGIGLVSGGAMFVLPLSTLAWLARGEGQVGEDVIRALYGLRAMTLPGMSIMTGMFIACLALTCERSRVVSSTLARIGYGVAVINTMGGIAAIYASERSKFWFAFGWLSFTIFCVWLVVVSVAASRSGGRSAGVEPRQVAATGSGTGS